MKQLPQLIKDHCLIAFRRTLVPKVAVRVYKWCGTDRVTLVWVRFREGVSGADVHPKAVCRLDMHYLDLYATVEEMVGDLNYLTQMMADGGWRDTDIRGDNKRVFGADFW